MMISGKLNLIVNWLFCLYLLELSDGILGSNKKYIELTPNPFTFVAYFLYLTLLIPCIVLLVIHFTFSRLSSLMAKIGILLAGSAVLTGGEYTLEAIGALHHSRVLVGASFVFWFLLLVLMLGFHAIVARSARKEEGDV